MKNKYYVDWFFSNFLIYEVFNFPLFAEKGETLI